MSNKVTASFSRVPASPSKTSSGSIKQESLNVEDPFSSGGSYAGSFRLRFLGSSGRKKKKKKQESDEDPKEQEIEDGASITEPSDSDQQSVSLQKQPIKTEYQEDSLTFTTEANVESQKAFAEAKKQNQMEALVDIPQESSNGKQAIEPRLQDESTTVDHGNWNLDEIFHSFSESSQPQKNVIAAEATNIEGPPPTYYDDDDTLTVDIIVPINGTNARSPETPQRGDEFELLPIASASPQPPEELKDDDFKFYPPEKEPILQENFKRRALRAVESVAFESSSMHGNCCKQGCWNFEVGKPHLTPELKTANDQGFKMLKKFLFPSMPKLMQDLWVVAELAFSITQLVLSIISLSIENIRAFNIAYLVLASIAVALALLDGFIYFIQLGSCAQCFRFLKKKKKSQKSSENNNENEKDSCSCLSSKTKMTVAEYFELTRNIVTELVIYPLLICDMFDFIVGGSLNRGSPADNVNFALFVIGCFYLFLAVYFMRAFIVISSTVQIRRIPINASNALANTVGIITGFSAHVMGQLLSSMLIIITIGVKIRQENPTPCMDDTSPCIITASPFLIYAAVVGGILPILGTVMYFVVNYYDLRVFAIGHWVDIMSLLKSESFAELVFRGNGVKVAKEKAKSFAEKVKLKEVKQQFEDVKNVSFWYKGFYPIKLPFLVAFGIMYELLLLSFIVTLMFTGDATNAQFILFEGGLSSALLITAAILLLVNIRMLLLFTTWLVIIPLWPVICIFL